MSTSASAKLSISRSDGPGGCVLRLSGVIDESIDRRKLIEGAHGVVVLDLDGVQRITSYGVREWVMAVKAIPHEYLCFARCRPAIVSQFNMVTNFGGSGQLVSFYAPYVCPSCAKDFDVLVDLKAQHAAVKAFSLPPARCPLTARRRPSSTTCPSPISRSLVRCPLRTRRSWSRPC
jgi:eukaryotic-like serine/threonine-protein kinase